MADESDNPPFPVGRASNIAIQATWAQKGQSDAGISEGSTSLRFSQCAKVISTMAYSVSVATLQQMW
jgi:hypothetical protein